MTIRPDSEVQRNVEAELFCCPDLDDTDIAVKVTDGTVTLSGYAPSFFDKFGAEDAAKRVHGVTAVANGIQVQARDGTGVPDPELARAAVGAIRHALPQCWEQVRPLVRSGCITLEGTLDWNYQRDLAEQAARTVKGATCVINAIALSLGTRSSGTHRSGYRRAAREPSLHPNKG
jgi:osmotically-inducible protein OsmY